ncbi:MAG: hypothetical protein QM504_18805 [Pseudomonadota bacterium]
MQTIFIFLFFNVIFSLIQISIASEVDDVTLTGITADVVPEREYKTRYGTGYEQRMEILQKQISSVTGSRNLSVIRIKKIQRPVRAYRPQRPIRPGR